MAKNDLMLMHHILIQEYSNTKYEARPSWCFQNSLPGIFQIGLDKNLRVNIQYILHIKTDHDGSHILKLLIPWKFITITLRRIY